MSEWRRRRGATSFRKELGRLRSALPSEPSMMVKERLRACKEITLRGAQRVFVSWVTSEQDQPPIMLACTVVSGAVREDMSWRKVCS